MPGKDAMPDPIKRSPKDAQRTWEKAHDSAVETYGEGRRAHQTAYAALKHKYQKVGDHWEPKGQKGPSDPRARSGRGRSSGHTHGGIDVAGSSKQELVERARKLGIPGRTSMRKHDLAEAIQREER
jgi:cation transport regulator ChaB